MWTISKATSGNDSIYSFSIDNQNLDGDPTLQDSLSWQMRVKAYQNSVYTLNGNNSSVTLGNNVAAGTNDLEYGVIKPFS